jgi:cyclin B
MQIDWLVEVHLKFRMRPETLYLTVNLIDRFLEKKLVARTKLQLVGCGTSISAVGSCLCFAVCPIIVYCGAGALFIASKFEEIYSPEVRDFVYITDKAYSAQEVMQMETIMLNTLDFYLTVPTPVIYSKKWVEVTH